MQYHQYKRYMLISLLHTYFYIFPMSTNSKAILSILTTIFEHFNHNFKSDELITLYVTSASDNVKCVQIFRLQ